MEQNFKYEKDEVVYAYYRMTLHFATVLCVRTVNNTYGLCSHLYTVQLTISQGETLDVEVDEMALFKHPMFVREKEAVKLVKRMAETIMEISSSHNRTKNQLNKEYTNKAFSAEEYEKKLNETDDSAKRKFEYSITQMEIELDCLLAQMKIHCQVQRLQSIPERLRQTILEYESTKVQVKKALFEVPDASALIQKDNIQPT